MRREFRIIRLKKQHSDERINDSLVELDVEISKHYEPGDLCSAYDTIVTNHELQYPIRDGRHYTTLITDRKTNQRLDMGHPCLRKLAKIIEELVRGGEDDSYL